MVVIKRIKPPILQLVLIGVLLLAGASVLTAADSPLADYEVVAENEYLVMYFNYETTEFAVQRKDTGTVWYSNPPHRDTEETIARGGARERLGAQLAITYFTPSDHRRGMDTANDSVAHGQFEIAEIPDGIRVEYGLGEEWAEEDYLPIMISRERFEGLILDNIEDDTAREILLDNYELVKATKTPEHYEKISIYQVEKNEVFGNYTIVSPIEEFDDDDRQELIELVIDKMIENRRDLTRRRDLSYDLLLPLLEQLNKQPAYILGDRIPAWDIDDMIKFIQKARYTPEDVTLDHQQHVINPPQPNIRVFSLAVEYRLEGDNMVVTVPSSEIEYPENVRDEEGNRVSFPLTGVDLLEFFGAAGPEAEGYMFVPDGSGALINLNNEKTYASPYEHPVYGEDRALSPREEKSRYLEQIHFPVFGMKQGESALLGIIEEGSALSRIRADIAGRANSYNRIYPQLIPVPQGQTELQGDVPWLLHWQVSRNVINIYQAQQYMDDFRVRYAFLDGEKSGYVGMADYYRNYLIEEGKLGPREDEPGDLPFYLEFKGAFVTERPVLGVPRRVVEPITPFDEAAGIVDRLQAEGVGNLEVRFTGWMRDGIRHRFPAAAHLEGRLGGRDDFTDLAAQLAAAGVGFYPDVSFINIYQNRRLDGFSPRSEASRWLNRRIARLYNYDLATYRRETDFIDYVYSPRRLPALVDSFLTDYENLEIGGLSVRNMGHQLNSDFREDLERLVDREQALDIHRDQLVKMTGSAGLDLMVQKANDYVLPYADHIVRLPFASNNYNIFDRDVPFMQLVLKGYVPFAGEPFNLAQEPENVMLRTVETGGIPYYAGASATSSVVKGTDFAYLYAVHYGDWLEEALEFYRRANAELAGLRSAKIVDHEMLEEGLYRTTFEGGVQVLVNYNPHSVAVGEFSVGAEDYLVIEGGG